MKSFMSSSFILLIKLPAIYIPPYARKVSARSESIFPIASLNFIRTKFEFLSLSNDLTISSEVSFSLVLEK